MASSQGSSNREAQNKRKKTWVKQNIINLFIDFGFKKIFGEEASKRLLIDYLNAFIA